MNEMPFRENNLAAANHAERINDKIVRDDGIPNPLIGEDVDLTNIQNAARVTSMAHQVGERLAEFSSYVDYLQNLRRVLIYELRMEIRRSLKDKEQIEEAVFTHPEFLVFEETVQRAVRKRLFLENIHASLLRTRDDIYAYFNKIEA